MRDLKINNKLSLNTNKNNSTKKTDETHIETVTYLGEF